MDLDGTDIQRYREIARKKNELARKSKNIEMWLEQDRENNRLIKEFGSITDGRRLAVAKASDGYKTQ